MAKRKALKDPDLNTSLIGGLLIIADDIFTLVGTPRKPVELEHVKRFSNTRLDFQMFQGTSPFLEQRNQIVHLSILISRHY